MVKKLHYAGINAGYYKAALSGAACIADSDAGYVKRIGEINQPESTLLSYLYQNAVSPHLAARMEGNPVELSKVIGDYQQVASQYDYITVEGSGGIVCPLRYDTDNHILLEDIVKALGLNTVIVAPAGLGTINAVALTAQYLMSRDIGIKGVIINHYTGGMMEEDNIAMIEALTAIPVLARVAQNATELEISLDQLKALYE